ncbi:hypothetical protein PVL29_021355 [Vitis rotundifolia]|uniref:FAS1 domain-containing protein n=1 Tax=Vitis rotundifolia TaxID=103349 RepID=A0AA38YZ55_VITRO|nr:hypothetical protein PVL29_021355 [Vitis rotundifolia]
MARIFMAICALVLFCSSSVYAQIVGSPSLSPSPAPAPAPPYVNLTDLLSVVGPFHTFLNYLVSTKELPSLCLKMMPSLSNFIEDQLKSLLIFHALPHYYSLADLKNLNQLSAVSTFAGGLYTLNFTDVSGTIHIGSGWTNTKVSSSFDKVLLPEAIFGTDIPPTPAPTPAPDINPAADALTASDEAGIISLGVWSQLVLAISGGLVLFL